MPEGRWDFFVFSLLSVIFLLYLCTRLLFSILQDIIIVTFVTN